MHAQIVPSGRTVYETPDAVFAPLNAEFGLTLDVCATPENAKLPRYFTEEQDGLAQDWTGERCWMNPPYGRGISNWVRKAAFQAAQGALVVALLPASTDTAWWHDYVQGRAEVRFIRGRLNFAGVSAESKSHNAPHPHVIAIWRPRLQKEELVDRG